MNIHGKNRKTLSWVLPVASDVHIIQRSRKFRKTQLIPSFGRKSFRGAERESFAVKYRIWNLGVPRVFYFFGERSIWALLAQPPVRYFARTICSTTQHLNLFDLLTRDGIIKSIFLPLNGLDGIFVIFRESINKYLKLSNFQLVAKYLWRAIKTSTDGQGLEWKAL